MIHIDIEDKSLQRALSQIQINATATRTLMRQIAGELHTTADMNIRRQMGADDRKFAALAESTKAARAKQGKWPGQILQVNNMLVRSITRHYGNDYAQIGSNIVYARIHQLGGKAGKNKKVLIPARPYLPYIDNNLQKGVESIILKLALAHLEQNV